MMGGFRRDGTGQAQSQSFLARHGRRRPSWRGHDRHWPGAAEKGGWAAKGAPCMLV
jgi:hypothetical protein